MKTNLLTMGAVVFVTALCLTTGYSQETVDLGVRQSIFFTGTDTTSLSKAEQSGQYSSPIYHPNAPHNHPDILKLNTGQATSCGAAGECTYNLGVLAWRDPGKGAVKDSLSTVGRFTTEDGSITSNTLIFSYDGNSKLETTEFILPVKLKIGKHKITFTIDPENKIAETNEGNNIVAVYFDVSWGYKAGQESAPPVPDKRPDPRIGKIPPLTATKTPTPTQKIPPGTVPSFPDLTLFSLEAKQVGIVTVLVRNTCQGKSAATTVRLEIFNGTDDGTGVRKSVNADVPALAPGGSATVKIYTGAHGEFDTVINNRLIKVTVDPDNRIREVSETNNWMTRQGDSVSDIFAPACTSGFPK